MKRKTLGRPICGEQNSLSDHQTAAFAARGKFEGRFCRAMLVVLPLLLCGSLSAATYYVDSSAGKDTNNGTSLPWKTIAKVNSSKFSPGDQILFKKGDLWDEALSVSSSGSSGKPIVYGAYGTGNAPILDEQNERYPAVHIENLSYVTINGLAIQNSASYSIWVQGSSYVTVENCAIKNSRSHGIYVNGASSDPIIENNSFTLDSTFNMTGSGIYVLATINGVTISGNTIVLNSAGDEFGIYVLDVDNAQVFNNTITSGAEGIGIKGYTRSVSGAAVYNNAVYNTSNQHGDGEAIEFTGNASGSLQVEGSIYHNFISGGSTMVSAITAVRTANTSVYGNLVVGPMLDAAYHFSSNCPNMLLYNNDSYNTPYGILIDSGSSATVMNNVISHASLRGLIVGSSAHATEDYNIFYSSGSNEGVSKGSHTNTSNPLFSSSTPKAPADFKLQSDSPAIGTGASLSSPYNMALDPATSCFPCGTVNQDNLGPFARGAFAYR